MKAWPKGYLQEETEFTEHELRRFYNYRGSDKKEVKRLKQDLLTKREIFKKYWEVKHGKD
jgi:hypothetical protein